MRLKLFYKQGWSDGYGQALQDCEPRLARSIQDGARLAYMAILERMRSCKDGLELAGVIQELEDALDR